MEMIKQHDLTEIVPVKNCCPWTVSFATVNNPMGFSIEANETTYNLTWKDVYTEVLNRRTKTFIGENGLGFHAPIQILNLDQYNDLFSTFLDEPAEELPKYLDNDLIVQILQIGNKKKFLDALEKNVITKADKKKMVLYIANNPECLDDVASGNVRAIEKHTGVSLAEYY